MADVEVVIKLPEEIIEYVKRNECLSVIYTDEVANAIINSAPLPKGHGAIKDADELHNIFEEKCDAYNIDNLSFISDMDMNFDLATTIIKADIGN